MIDKGLYGYKKGGGVQLELPLEQKPTAEIINLLDYTLKKKITTSGGPRAFGNFIIEN